jgi:PAS domain S-box-containing protein
MLDDRVAIEQMLLFCKQKHLLVAMAVTILCMTIFLWGTAPLNHLIIIQVLAVIVIAVRVRSITEFSKLSPLEINIHAWKNRFVRMAVFSGSIFVAMELVGYMALNNERWGSFDIVVMSACGAALGSMTLVPGLYPYFAIPPLFVMAVFHAVEGGFYNFFIAFCTIVAGVAYLATSRNVEMSIGQSLRLRIQNEILTAAAEQQHHHMAAILNNLPDATFAIDSNGIVTAWNQAAEEMTGVKAAEIIGKGNYEYAVAFYDERRPILIDLLSEADSECQKIYSHFTRRGDTLTGEGLIASRGLWFEASASPLRDALGNIAGGIETVRDITDRKNIQIELEASKHRLADIIDLFPDAAFVVDKNGVITAWNRAAERMTGTRAVDMIGKGNREYAIPFYGERRPIMIDMVLFPAHKAYEKYQYVRLVDDVISGEAYIRPNGKELWIQAYATLLHDAQDNVIGAIETVRDITEHKQLEEELQASERQLSQIIDLLPGATFVIDSDGIVTAWNRAAEQMTGVEATDIIGKGDHEYAVAFYGKRRPILIDLVFLPEHELLQEAYSHVRKTGDTLFAESHVTMRNGRTAWLQGSAGILRDADGRITGAIEVVLDQTERKRFEDDLAAAREVAERASQAKADFLANMSHEIRTPMNAIIGMSYLTLQTELTSKQHNYVQKIHRAAENLLGIINEILDFSKIEAGKLSMEKIDFQLEDVMDNLANLLGIRAEDKGLELLFNISPEIPTTLTGDPLRLGQVLVNLGNNAVKFTEYGEIIVGIETVALTPQDVKLHFWVQDSGIGMTWDHQQKLFQSFSQLNNP